MRVQLINLANFEQLFLVLLENVYSIRVLILLASVLMISLEHVCYSDLHIVIITIIIIIIIKVHIYRHIPWILISREKEL